MSGKSLMERLLDAGYPAEEMYHYESDLYIFATNNTASVIQKWCKDNGLRRDLFCTFFTDQITGRPMYDCAFQYTPYWEGKCNT